MGWWQIDPATGMPLRTSGKDPAQVDECYTGDSPWDAAAGSMEELRELVGDAEFTPDEAKRLVFNRIVPDWVDPGDAAEVLRIVDAMWDEVDDCYEESWERKAKPLEKRVAGEQAIWSLTGAEDD